MDFSAPINFIFILVALNYTAVIVSIAHLIFRSNYTLTERLLWMVVLWVVPVLGPLAYWIFWSRRQV